MLSPRAQSDLQHALYLGKTYRIVSVAPLPFGGLAIALSPGCMAFLMTSQQIGIL
ncbi:hypothetical protein [Candidatus Cryosericum terrychapinii]|nr:hypothetical protein [Candidatus Cryosericum terrychapinii]